MNNPFSNSIDSKELVEILKEGQELLEELENVFD